MASRQNYGNSGFMCGYGFMPPKNLIARQTRLSGKTVIKHFKEYKTHPGYQAMVQQYKFMAPMVLASFYKHANNGEAKVARLNFEMVGARNKQQQQQPCMVVNDKTTT